MSLEAVPIIKKRTRPQPRIRAPSIHDTEMVETNEDDANLP
jgi:hypothetical protein